MDPIQLMNLVASLYPQAMGIGTPPPIDFMPQVPQQGGRLQTPMAPLLPMGPMLGQAAQTPITTTRSGRQTNPSPAQMLGGQ